MLSLQAKLLRFPPAICFVLARTKVPGKGRGVLRPLTVQEISERSGLPEHRVIALSWALSWNDVTCGEMLAFTKGCGIDFNDRRNLQVNWAYVERRKGIYPHLIKHPRYSEYRHRIQLWFESLRKHKESSC